MSLPIRLAVLAAAAALATPSFADPHLVLEQSIPLENVSGRIDHMAIDLAGKRLFVAELGNNSVDVVDLEAGKATARISGLKDPQGLAYLAGQDLLVVASAGDGSVRFYRASDLSPEGSVVLGDDADNIRIDPKSGDILVGYGDGGLAVIDPATRSKLQDIRLPGHPESFQIDAKTNRAYINIPDADEVAAVDLTSGKQIAAWQTPGLSANFPMALDDAGARLAIIFRHPASLAFLDPATGHVTETIDTCGDADDMFFDHKRDRIYVSCGEGMVDVMERRSAGFRSIGRIATSNGARTSIFVPELDRLFVAARAGTFGSRAAVLVLRPSP